MKIALGQIESIPNNPKHNLQAIKYLCVNAKKQDCDLIVFPELADFGYDTQAIKEVTPKIYFEELSLIAKFAGITLITGHLTFKKDNYYNSQIVLSDQGELISKYDKIHLIDHAPFFEKSIFQPGTEVKVFSFKNVIFGQSICYDLRFPELYRSCRAQNASIFVCSSCWPYARLDQKLILARARAIENQCFFIASCASSEERKFSGNSFVISPTGEIITLASTKQELIITEIDLKLVEDLREKFNTFKDVVL